MKLKYLVLSFALLSALVTERSQADSFGVNIYGRSYHFGELVVDRDVFNEVNTGIGLRFDFGSRNGNSFFIEGGAFEDSFYNEARYVSMAYLIQIMGSLRLGLNAAIYNSPSANHGKSFFAPIPILSWRVWHITLNATYFPRYDKINPFHIIGGYLTFDLFQNDN